MPYSRREYADNRKAMGRQYPSPFYLWLASTNINHINQRYARSQGAIQGSAYLFTKHLYGWQYH